MERGGEMISEILMPFAQNLFQRDPVLKPIVDIMVERRLQYEKQQ